VSDGNVALEKEEMGVLRIVLTVDMRLADALVIVSSASDLPLRTIKCYSVVFGVKLSFAVNLFDD